MKNDLLMCEDFQMSLHHGVWLTYTRYLSGFKIAGCTHLVFSGHLITAFFCISNKTKQVNNNEMLIVVNLCSLAVRTDSC